MGTVIHGATRRIIEVENQSGRRSHSRRVTVDETHDLVKIVLVGDAGVGKTCFMIRFVRDQFVSSTRSTVGKGSHLCLAPARAADPPIRDCTPRRRLR